jgi:hypothetical protein
VTQKLLLVLSAGLIVGAWAICALTYAEDGGGGYNGGQFAILILIAAAATIWAGTRLARGWLQTKRTAVGTLLVSVFAVAAIVLLALAIRGRG